MTMMKLFFLVLVFSLFGLIQVNATDLNNATIEKKSCPNICRDLRNICEDSIETSSSYMAIVQEVLCSIKHVVCLDSCREIREASGSLHKMTQEMLDYVTKNLLSDKK